MASWWRLRGVHRGSTAGPGGGCRGAKTAGATPTTGCVTPPGGVGVERRREIYLIVAPSLRNDHDLVPRAEIGGFSPRSAGAPPKRSDGARLGVISLRRSTPTPPGGVTQPVVGVAPAVLAPRRAPTGPAVDPRGRPRGATSVSCTSLYILLDSVAHSEVPDISPLSEGWSGPRADTISPQSSLCL